MNDHAVTGKAAREELVGGAPKIEAETTIVEFAKAGDDCGAIAIEVARPLQGGVEVAVPIVEQLQHFERRLGERLKKVMQDHVGVVAAVNVFHDEGGQIVFLRVSAAIEEDVAARV